MPNKEEIYQQIHKFNTDPSVAGVQNSPTIEKTYFFVPSEIAKERASFFRWLIEQEEILEIVPSKWKALDLAFGSGNLTTHILKESGILVEKVVYNDKNASKSNNEIQSKIANSSVWHHDFLNAALFPNEKFNLVIFNPQTGGAFTEGISGLSEQKTILSDKDLKTYLESQGKDTSELTFSTDDAARSIKVHSATLNKTPLKTLIGDIKSFNYHDVLWQSKESKIEGESSNNVKLRMTFDKVFETNGILIYYGDDSFFEALFADFNFVVKLCSPDSGKMLFFATKAISDTKTILYKKAGNSYTEVDSCKEEGVAAEEGDLDEIETEIDEISDEFFQSSADNLTDLAKKQEETKDHKESYLISDESLGSLDFPYKNVLLKGVPGTGKSRLIDEWIKNRLGLVNKNHDNVLRINIHSASSNADLMQGIGITSNRGQVEYHEKTGLLMNHLKLACQHPNQPFVIVLEEIQENSLNELIGDLIYLIEESKRVDLRTEVGKEFESFEAFVNQISEEKSDLEYVRVPYLVKTETKFRKLIFPANLFVFCTSNYRDDKKVVEDNLMRRFDLIEMYPVYTKALFFNTEVKDFLEKLNFGILAEFATKEIHPDRLIVGHANWLKDKVINEISFCRALLKAIVEFKDIREIEWSEIKPVLDDISVLPFALDVELIRQTNYQELIVALQEKAFGKHLNG